MKYFVGTLLFITLLLSGMLLIWGNTIMYLYFLEYTFEARESIKLGIFLTGVFGAIVSFIGLLGVADIFEEE